jgi:pimeloyl-ACP methyl ester carboxylesterase
MNWREFQNRQRLFEYGDQFVSYVDDGKGDAVVLLHGIPTWGYLWEGILPALDRKHRVLIPDLLGYGYSDKSDRFDRSIARQTEMICALLDHLGIERAAVVGHDIGGGIALRMAVLFSRRVARLAVINSACYDSWPIEFAVDLGEPLSRKAPVEASLPALKLALRTAFASPLEDELIDPLLVPYSTEVGKLSLIRNAAALNTNHTTEITDLLPRIGAPTLILWGEADTFQLLEYAERLAGDIPEAQIVRFKGSRHFVMLEERDEVASRLASFLDAA